MRKWNIRRVNSGLTTLHPANKVSARAEQPHMQPSEQWADWLGAMQQTNTGIIWKQFSYAQRQSKHPCLPRQLRCQMCLALKVILRYAWTHSAWPNDAGRFNWNATKWNSSWAALCCPSLPIPHLAQPPAKYIRKDVWLKLSKLVLSDNNHTQLKNICFKKIFHFFHWHLLQELYFRLLHSFYNRSLS